MIALGLLDIIIHGIGSDKRLGNLFLASRTDNELNQVREEVRQDMCAGSEKAYYNLERIDRIIAARQPRSKSNKGFPRHTENGWHLPEDD